MRELPPMPARIASLPIDPERGYPVPFFVAVVNGKYAFHIADSEKWTRCVNKNLCWVCGQKLGRYLSFVIGPMCSINRISADPASHLDCAVWSVKACPFLTKPKMVRREDELAEKCKGNVPGIMIERNPGVMLIWTTREIEIIRDNGAGRLFQLGKPDGLSWWREGRLATREEIMESIRTGLPSLEEQCFLESTPERVAEAQAALKAATREAMKLLPA